MAEHDDLDGEIGIAATDEPDQLEDATERPVEEREGHRRMLAAGAFWRRSPAQETWTRRHYRTTRSYP